MTSSGEPYGPWKYKELVRDCYIISKNCNTSYTDLMHITPIERDYMIEFIIKEGEEAKKRIEQRMTNIE